MGISANRGRREKIFGPAPSQPLDGNAKARVWAAAGAYNARERREGQHQGPLTWATLRVLRALLWRFHGADGGGRCFPSYERIAAAAKCARSSVAVALKALEEAGLLSWVNRLSRVRVFVRDLFGRGRPEWKLLRISNGYELLDPLRQGSKSENRTRPQNRDFKKEPESGARLAGAPVYVGGPARSPSQTTAPSAALRGEHGLGGGVPLSPTERAAIIARMDRGEASKEDYVRYEHLLDARINARSAK